MAQSTTGAAEHSNHQVDLRPDANHAEDLALRDALSYLWKDVDPSHGAPADLDHATTVGEAVQEW